MANIYGEMMRKEFWKLLAVVFTSVIKNNQESVS